MFGVRDNFPEVQRWIDTVGKQARYATSVAMNQTMKDAQTAIKAALPRVFDRPTPYIVNSIRITTWAKPGALTAVLEPAYLGGKGVDPQKVLAAEIFGGTRRLKRSEVALQRVGILPPGYVTVPGSACPLDEYGNVKGSFIVQLLSYFAAFGEQGYRANMTDKRKAKLAKRGVTASGYRIIGGVEYFVSYGKLRGGRAGHLHPGIWSRSGIHGATIKPILMFVPGSHYKPRFDLVGLGVKTIRERFPSNFGTAFADAMRTAR
jgi:hypothetical protein